jgi:tyrosinase
VVIVLAVVAVVILGVVGAAVALFSAADSVLDTTFAEGGGIPEGTRLLDTGGSVSATGGTARFEFTVADRTAVQIDVIGRNGFDPVTTLYGPGGVVIQEDDDGGSGFDSRIARELTAGTYVVEIEGFAGDTGDFDIIVTDR